MPRKLKQVCAITPLEPAVIASIVDAAIKLDREIKDNTKRLNELKGQLITESTLHPEQHLATDGGGVSWIAKSSNGDLARVTFPADKLKDRIDPGTDAGAKLLAMVGRGWQRFFRREVVFKPLEDFRARVESAFDTKFAARLIKACESDSKPAVSFETATNQETR